MSGRPRPAPRPESGSESRSSRLRPEPGSALEPTQRPLFWLAAGILASVLFARLLEWNGETFAAIAGSRPLTGTLVALPLAAGLFAAAAALAQSGPSGGWIRLGAAVSCGILALRSHELGLRWSEALLSGVVMAAITALALGHAIAQTAVLSRLDAGLKRTGALVLTVLAVYALALPWTHRMRPPNGDEPYYLLLTHSLAYDHDTDLANNYEAGDSLRYMGRKIGPQYKDPVGPEGQMYSRHNATLSLVLAPIYRWLGPLGVLAAMALMTAAFAGGASLLTERYYPDRPREALWAGAVTGLAPPLLLYSYQVWVEVPAALVAIGVTLAIHHIRARTGPGETGFPVLAAGSGLAGLLLLSTLKLRFLALAAGLTMLAWSYCPPHLKRWVVRLGLGLGLVFATTLLFNTAVFGAGLKHHSWGSLLGYATSPLSYARGLGGIFFDASFGLFATGPIWILLLPGAVLTARSRPRILVDLALATSLYCALLAPRLEWYGGWSPPFRYALVLLPFLAPLLVPTLGPALGRRGSTRQRTALAALGAATVALSLVWVVLPGWTYNFADGRSLLLDHLGIAFGGDLARFFPSFVRPRPANLVWVAALGLSAGVFAARAGRRARGTGVAAGVVLFVLALACLPLVAGTPHRVVQFEDPYVTKNGGALYPERWRRSRVTVRGAWELEPGDSVSIPIRPAGTSLAIELEVMHRVIRKRAAIEVLENGAVIHAQALPPAKGWLSLRLGPIPWSGASELTFRLRGPKRSVAFLDRAVLRWHGTAP